MKSIAIFGGGTFSYVRNHLALAAPAFGETARRLYLRAVKKFPDCEVKIHLTKMADSQSTLVTNEDVFERLNEAIKDENTKAIIFNVALCDFMGNIVKDKTLTPSGKHAQRLKTRELEFPHICMTPEPKLIPIIKQARPDVFLVAFKTTCGESLAEMVQAGVASSINTNAEIVWVNDTKTRNNMLYYNCEPHFMLRNECADAVLEKIHATFQSEAVQDLHSK